MSYQASQPVVANSIGVIGGSGVYSLECLEDASSLIIDTPFGAVTFIQGHVGGCRVAFVARHGAGHKVPPHKINYRANIWALREWGAEAIIAVNAVGGIAAACEPGSIVIPDQLIDYTFGREHTYADLLTPEMNHIEFTEPYSFSLRQQLIGSARTLSLDVIPSGCYACMQGPRLETAAEIKRLERDGNSVVGMTSMPEAALAKELSMDYASICIVANWAAGIGMVISLDSIHQVLSQSGSKVQAIIAELLTSVT